jgi:hypothetical protein
VGETESRISISQRVTFIFLLSARMSQECRNLSREVQDERMKLWGTQNVETLGAIRHLAKTYHAQGRLNQAAELQQQVVFGMEKLLKENHPRTLSVREEL